MGKISMKDSKKQRLDQDHFEDTYIVYQNVEISC